MAIFLIIIAFIVFLDMKVKPKNEFNNDYIARKQTTAINGLFTILVFFSHVCTYIKLDSPYDAPYTAFKSYLLQMVVVPFLFYSGYGIMESIKVKGTVYVKRIPKERFLKVLIHFDIAVIFFLILNFALGKTFSIKRILLAFTGYSAVGNSNWYIFAVLGLYLIVFVSFMLARKNNILGVIIATVLSIGFVLAQILLKRSSWCYDTIILFPVGMIFSLMKNPLEKLVTKNDIIYYSAFSLTFLAYTFFYFKRSNGIEFYSMWGILFMALIVLITMKITVGNGILEFFGSHVFSIYILQRLPMIILSKTGLASGHKYIFVVACLVTTILLAVVFDAFTDKLDGILFRKRQKKELQ